MNPSSVQQALHRGWPAKNLIIFRPRKGDSVVAEFGIPRSDVLTDALIEAGLDVMDYDTPVAKVPSAAHVARP